MTFLFTLISFLFLCFVLILFGVWIQKNALLRKIAKKYFYAFIPGYQLQRVTPPESSLFLHSKSDWDSYPYSYVYEELEDYLHDKVAERSKLADSENVKDSDILNSFKEYLFGQEIELCNDKDIKLKSDVLLLIEDKYQIHHIVIESKIKGISVDFILGIPNDIIFSKAIVTLHGFSSSPQKIMGFGKQDYSNSIGLEFVKAGYLVAAPFVFNHGDRLSSLGALASLIDTTMEGIALANIFSCLDYMSYTYGTEQFGVYGISGGATLALYAGALDDRIACIAASGVLHDKVRALSDMAAGKGIFLNRTGSLYTHYFNTKYPFYFQFSFPKIAALICPKPLLLENGSKDYFYKFYDSDAEFLKIKDHYIKNDCAENVSFKTFTGYHEANVQHTLEWMSKNIDNS